MDATTRGLTQLADGFWNIRGSFRIAGLVDVGTHCSLVRLGDGRFVFLDSYTLSAPVRTAVDALTGGGAKVAAILNLHPFHTLHCTWIHEAFPKAELYGTQRHREKLPDLPWHEDACEGAAVRDRFGADFAFSMPDGVPLVCADESVHFASILALHRVSGTIHVDDTLVYLDKGFPISLLPMNRRLDFHPTLATGLEPRAGAADAFRAWAIGLGSDWADARRIAAAHDGVLAVEKGRFPDLVGEALARVSPVLDRHRAKYG